MSASKTPRLGSREVIFEIHRIGEIQRVAAIDVESGVEVVIQAPARAAEHDVRALALAKLERALKESSPEDCAAPKRGGKLV